MLEKEAFFSTEKEAHQTKVFGKDVYMWKDKRKGCLILESAFWFCHLSYTQNSFFYFILYN